MSVNQLGRSIPLVRGLFMSTPPYHVGSVLENRLGLQVGRIFGKYCVRALRSSEVPADAREHMKVLRRDGVLAIPDFLPVPAFQKLLNEVEGLRRTIEFQPFRERHGRLSVARLMLSPKPGTHPQLSYLRETEMIRRIAGAISKVPPVSGPVMELTIYKVTNPGASDNDEENLLHADLHSPTAKCFYYLSDVDETNGAFIYAKGSHRLSYARLKYEYDLSIRTARLNRGERLMPGVEERAGTLRAVMTAEQRSALGIIETAFPVRANTLVIANNVGFHRRGQFTSERERASIVLNFRHYQRPFWS